MIEKDKKMKENVEENIELTHQEKLEGQLECLRQANEILRKVIERHESQRNRN